MPSDIPFTYQRCQSFISNTNYDKFVNDNLSDTNTYKILESDPLDNIKLKINKPINELVSAKTLSKRFGIYFQFFKYIFVPQTKL